MALGTVAVDVRDHTLLQKGIKACSHHGPWCRISKASADQRAGRAGRTGPLRDCGGWDSGVDLHYRPPSQWGPWIHSRGLKTEVSARATPTGCTPQPSTRTISTNSRQDLLRLWRSSLAAILHRAITVPRCCFLGAPCRDVTAVKAGVTAPDSSLAEAHPNAAHAHGFCVARASKSDRCPPDGEPDPCCWTLS